MTDLGACLLLDSLKDFKKIFNHRKKIFKIYKKNLSKINSLSVLQPISNDYLNSFWLCTIICERRFFLQKKLREYKIETNQVHFRNDRYSIFKKFSKKSSFPNMNKIEDKYLVIPINHTISEKDAHFISKKINEILK